MPNVRPDDEFARMLGALEKDDFESEVCAFLRRCISDFQDVPAQPQGDGGLDGLSHGQTIGYCCYGPEQEPSKVNARGLKPDIVKKFRSDLRKLFEISSGGKGKAKNLTHRATDELTTILAAGNKLRVVRLISSVFNTHQILGPLNTSFNEYKAASQCRYVDMSATLTIWGPKQLATVGAVDDLTLMSLEQRTMLKRVAAVLAGGAVRPAPQASDFDAKFDWIEKKGKVPPASVSRLRDHFRNRWGEAIAVENDLANNALALHEALTRARQEAAIDAEIASGTATNAMDLLEKMRHRLGQRLDEQPAARFPPDIRSRVVDAELARLLGECPVDWRT